MKTPDTSEQIRSLGHAPSEEQKEKHVECNDVPCHIGMIMDGNRRWAKKHKLPTAEGHREGAKTLEKLVERAAELGIETITVYAFSSENLVKRTKKEVQGLMELLGYFLRVKRKMFQEKGVRLTVLGELKAFPKDLQKGIHRTVDLLKNNERIKLNIALNYGGRGEIVRAVQNIINEGIEADKINEELISRHLYTCDSEDPDLIIRTGGELRLSNFLIWQASYSEFYFTDTLWPDFSPEGFDEAIEEYKKRNRRRGGQ